MEQFQHEKYSNRDLTEASAKNQTQDSHQFSERMQFQNVSG